MPSATTSTPISRYNSASPPPQYHYSHHVPPSNNSLVKVMDVLNRSMTNQYMILQETLRQSQCDGKSPKEFGTWLDEVSRLATICYKNPVEVAFSIPKGTLHKYINELVSSSMSWLLIKAQLQERFSECRGATMAKHKLTQLKHLELPMHEYITKFGDMVEYVYSIKLTNCASIILASNFIEGVQNPHIKNKLRSYQVKNLKDIFVHAIHKNQKKKIRALDFGISSKPDPILNCTINAIKDKACFKSSSVAAKVTLSRTAPWASKAIWHRKVSVLTIGLTTTATTQLTRSWSP